MANLIILRGPSASGKSTVATLLKKTLKGKVAVFDFDIFRKNFLGLQGDYYPVAAKMLMDTALTALEAGYEVIIDGFYRMEMFPDLLPNLIKKHPDNNYMFYFDVSLDATIERHSNREKSDDFGEKELREWYYKPKASGIYDSEYRISETMTIDETLEFINSKIR